MCYTLHNVGTGKIHDFRQRLQVAGTIKFSIHIPSVIAEEVDS
jgi:hypothetical protein